MILIVASKFDKSNGNVMDGLIDSAISVLEKQQIKYKLIRVPGAVELPVTIQYFMQKNKSFTAAIALGCVIKGESDHYELVTKSATDGLTSLALKLNKPVIQGVLACHNEQQAIARKNLGAEFAETAIELTHLLAE